MMCGALLLLVASCRKHEQDRDNRVAVVLVLQGAFGKARMTLVTTFDGETTLTQQHGETSISSCHYSVAPERVREVLGHMSERGFWDLDARYSMETNDLSPQILCAWNGSEYKSVVNYWASALQDTPRMKLPQYKDINWEAHRTVGSLCEYALDQLGGACWLR